MPVRQVFAKADARPGRQSFTSTKTGAASIFFDALSQFGERAKRSKKSVATPNTRPRTSSSA